MTMSEFRQSSTGGRWEFKSQWQSQTLEHPWDPIDEGNIFCRGMFRISLHHRCTDHLLQGLHEKIELVGIDLQNRFYCIKRK